MKMTFWRPTADIEDTEGHYLVRSVSMNEESKVEGCLSFKGRELESKMSEEEIMVRLSDRQSPLNTTPNRDVAALKLQKTYKSFRTRRQLADCAVLVEQRWWKLLDFAELKHSSISFFDIDKPESVVSRWTRARTRAAKVGKGLSKDDKARKLALQHWLEAIDPRHRYGHNLQFYYVNWLHCDSTQPFFYWLDVGEGREVNLERCTRPHLQQQCIKYLGPTERRAYEVIITDGKLKYKQSGKLLNTNEGPEDVKWIFVLSVSKILYVGQKKKGMFQHSSFLAGGATLSAGRLVVEDGLLKAVWPHSGHYLPTEENFEEFMTFLLQHNVDLTVVRRPCSNEEEVLVGTGGLHNSFSVPDLRKHKDGDGEDSSKPQYSKDDETICRPKSRWSRRLHSKITLLQIPKRDEMSELFKTPKLEPLPESPVDEGYETAEENPTDSEFWVSKKNLFDQDEEQDYEEPVPKEKIIKRINSHKGMKSYQLAKQLLCKWTTGAGPRIGCVRDYPSELRIRAMEKVHLSPRSSYLSPRKSAKSGLGLTLTCHADPETSIVAACVRIV